MDNQQGISDVVTRLQGRQHAFAGGIQDALRHGLTATQIADLTDLSTREVSALIKAWELNS